MESLNGFGIDTVVIGPIETNCYIVFDEKSRSGIVIDPGDEPEKILGRIKELGLRIESLVLTHGHYDHIGGLAQLSRSTGAKTAIHNDDAELLCNPVANGSLIFGHAFEVPPVDRLLSEGDTIPIGALSLTVIHTPGHTQGSMCLAGPGFVFSGDTLFRNSVGRVDLPGSEPKKLIPSIRGKLLSLPDETLVFPGHGDATTIGHERKRNPHLAGA